MTYELHEAHVKRDDGAFIPKDEGNRDYQEYLAWVAEGNEATVPPAPPPAAVVVSRLQARAALLQAGLLQDVEDTVAQTTEFTRLVWAEATEWRSDSPTLLMLVDQVGLTETQLTDLFTYAKTVNP